MTDLLSQLPAEKNYFFQIDESRHSSVKVFAPHGGCIEPCTGNIVMEIAGGYFDYFIFNGVRRVGCYKTLHVTSTGYDEPTCLAMVRNAQMAVAVHGCGGNESFIEIGGSREPLCTHLANYLAARDYPVGTGARGRTGESKMNFINQAMLGGIQIELSAGFRRLLFPQFPKTLQRNPDKLPRFVHAMRNWMKSVEDAITDGRGFLSEGSRS